jgi:hypothetical protein
VTLILNERLPDFLDILYTFAVFEILEEYFATLVSYLAFSSTLKMESIRSSETSANFNRLHGVISQNIVLFVYYATSREFLIRIKVP